MNFTIETSKRYLRSVLNNFHEYGFSYRSVALEGEDATHGLTIEKAVEEAFAGDLCHVTLTNVKERSRKIGLLVVLDHPQPPMDLIADYGAANEDDMEIAQRCIEGGSGV